MGSCISSNVSSSVPSTAKLILMDGNIQEFSEELKSHEILRQYSGHFICNSDGLYVGQKISQILGDDDRLQIGQLYFLLPQRKLQFLLTESDMASLLFKINAALSKDKKAATRKSKLSCGFGKAKAQVQPLFDIHLQHDECGKEYHYSPVCCMSRRRNVPTSNPRCRGRTPYQAKLETIAEIP